MGRIMGDGWNPYSSETLEALDATLAAIAAFHGYRTRTPHGEMDAMVYGALLDAYYGARANYAFLAACDRVDAGETLDHNTYSALVHCRRAARG